MKRNITLHVFWSVKGGASGRVPWLVDADLTGPPTESGATLHVAVG